jgi:hypothetical protein
MMEIDDAVAALVREPSVRERPFREPIHAFQDKPMIEEEEEEEEEAAAAPPNNEFYRMSRNITTVPLLWQEWTSGINGGPSIRTLEASYGTRWRREQADRKFYADRKLIINAINDLAADGNMSEAEAVSRVEARRAGRSFYQLIRELKARNRGPLEREADNGRAGPAANRSRR